MSMILNAKFMYYIYKVRTLHGIAKESDTSFNEKKILFNFLNAEFGTTTFISTTCSICLQLNMKKATIKKISYISANPDLMSILFPIFFKQLFTEELTSR